MTLPCAGTIVKHYVFTLVRCEILPFSVREGSEAEGAVVNDSPVGCQSRDLTEPQRDHDPPLQCKTIISSINRNLTKGPIRNSITLGVHL